VERKFWDERFPEYKQWKLEQEQFFRSHGYIDFYTGFRCAGALSKNEIANYSIQGSSFHCLLWTLIEVNKVAKDNNVLFTVQIRLNSEITSITNKLL
jgi:hypothetical protein